MAVTARQCNSGGIGGGIWDNDWKIGKVGDSVGDSGVRWTVVGTVVMVTVARGQRDSGGDSGDSGTVVVTVVVGTVVRAVVRTVVGQWDSTVGTLVGTVGTL
eukprot:8676119-Pyramimonas_sp.AAC.1